MNELNAEFDFREQINTAKSLKYLYRFLGQLIQDAVNHFPKSVDLKLLISFVQRTKLHNEFKAIFELMSCELSCDPSLNERFTIFTRKVDIEHQLYQNSDKNAQLTGSLDVRSAYRYERLY